MKRRDLTEEEICKVAGFLSEDIHTDITKNYFENEDELYGKISIEQVKALFNTAEIGSDEFFETYREQINEIKNESISSAIDFDFGTYIIITKFHQAIRPDDDEESPTYNQRFNCFIKFNVEILIEKDGTIKCVELDDILNYTKV